ncbi:amino acid adenylation domain-containing protein [Paenibacillus kandeliae]|uniref:amino acid adenylation domain-containing protein n=1 Tax=Paenibacillus kandeliae TaxID=3231269 RepID=UPI003458CCF2
MEKSASSDRPTGLKQRLNAHRKQKQSVIPRHINNEQDGYILSAAQQRMWFMEKLSPHSAMYNIPQALSITGVLDIHRLEQALMQVIARHPILRTVYREDQQRNEVRQYIHQAPSSMLQRLMLYDLNQDVRESYIQEKILEYSMTPFQLDGGELVRICLFELQPDEHILFLNFHHSIIDGWSMGIFWNELFAYYAQPKHVLPEPTIHYHDFAEWEQQLSADYHQKHVVYWQKYLHNSRMVRLDPDLPDLLEHDLHQGNVREYPLSATLSQRIIDYCQREDVTPYLFFMTAFHLFVHKYTGESDITTGTPTSGRIHKETYPLIGFFVDMMAVRTTIHEQQSFANHLAQVKTSVLACMDHQAVSFEQVIQALQPERELNTSPLFQMTFAYQQEEEMPVVDGLHMKRMPIDNHTSKYDCSLFACLQSDQSFHLVCEYNSALYSAERISQWMNHYEQLLEQLLSNSHVPVSTLHLITLAEQDEILNDHPHFPASPSTFLSIMDRFEHYAQTIPQHTALVIGDRTYTYAALNELAERLAASLQSRHIQQGSLVGIHFGRSEKIIIAILGIMKAGAAYVPLDPSYPMDRLQYMAEKAELTCIVSDREDAAFADFIPVWSLAALLHEPDQLVRSKPVRVLPQDTAYIIFTSGSTGAPKGVVIEHGSLSHLIDAQQTVFHLQPHERVLQFASMSFDASVWEIVMALGHGLTLCMLPSDWKDMQLDMVTLLNQYGITIGTFPSSFLNNLQPESLTSLQKVIVAGERCPVELASRWAASKLFWNAYGPSETTVCATVFPYVAGPKVPIGYPLPNMKAYVLDEQGNPVPPGRSGELYIGGAGLAREYRNDPVQTAAKFVMYTAGEEQQRLYRTGDMVKYDHDGVLEFLDRIDNQVKIRGYRVELGEIEHHLRLIPGIQEAFVTCIPRTDQPDELAAYIVVKPQHVVNRAAMLAHLSGTLPSYMIPVHLVELDHMPLTSNGKVDKKQLPAPVITQQPTESSALEERELSIAEQQLVSACSKVLHRAVRITDHFFEIGGDSILILKLMNELKKNRWSVTPRSVYQSPILEMLAHSMQPLVIHEAATEIDGQDFALSPMQHWFFKQQFTDAHHWNFSLMLQLNQQLDVDQIEYALRELYERHDALRLEFHNGSQGYRQSYQIDGSIPLHVIDYVGTGTMEAFIQETGAVHQRSLHIRDRLIVAVWMRDPAQPKSYLLLVVHHLLTDWVSGGIMAEDLNMLLQQSMHRQLAPMPISVSERTSSVSFQQWIQYMAAQTSSAVVQADIPYWQSIEQIMHHLPSLPVDHTSGRNRRGDTEVISLTLTKEQTTELIQLSHHTLHSTMEHVLLSAIVRVIQQWTGRDQLALDIDGHGRHDVGEYMDTSRTMGWFTSVYPLLLQGESQRQLTDWITYIDQVRQQVPHHGLTYGMLCTYDGQQPLIGCNADVLFNYFGHQHVLPDDSAASDETPIAQLCELAAGDMNSAQQERVHTFEIVGMIHQEQLMLGWQYSNQLHTESTIHKLVDQVHAELMQLIAGAKETYLT